MVGYVSVLLNNGTGTGGGPHCLAGYVLVILDNGTGTDGGAHCLAGYVSVSSDNGSGADRGAYYWPDMLVFYGIGPKRYGYGALRDGTVLYGVASISNDPGVA